MKIVFTGGGTGGHFYPLIAIAEQINDIADQQHFADVSLYYFSDTPYDDAALLEQRIKFQEIQSGKLGLSYGLLKKLESLLRVAIGTATAFWKLFLLFPDVVIGKGGYASVPTILAAWLLRIPVIIHESDTVPGRANKLMGKLATRVALTYPQAAVFFPKDKVAVTGQPIRRAIMSLPGEGAYEYLGLEPGVPVVFVLGGSLGARLINDAVVNGIVELTKKFQVVHQAGPKNIEEIEKLSTSILGEQEEHRIYRPMGYLSPLAMGMAASVASVIVTRAGSQLQEIASWGVPAIVIPITHSNGDHQRKNAFSYAGSGAAIVVEEANLAPHILVSEITRIIESKEISDQMKEACKKWHNPEAAHIIAEEAITLAREHLE